MAKSKKINTVKKQPAKQRVKDKEDPRVECIYEEEIEYMCPTRGLIKQKVKVVKYKTLSEHTKYVIPSDSALDKLENQDNGLAIYGNEGEE